MSKNRELKPEEKVEIVRKWQAGEISINAAGRSAGVNPKTIRRWITRYKAEGITGFLPQNQNRVYPLELKRQAVQGYLSGGGSLREIRKKYKLRSNCQPREWIKVYNPHGNFSSVKHFGAGAN